MIVYTDSTEYAARLLAPEAIRGLQPAPARDGSVAPLAEALLAGDSAVHTTTTATPAWTHLFITGVAADSQCDQLIRLLRLGHVVPDRLVAAACTGQRFHGFKGRHWAAPPGNLHLAVHFAPRCEVERFEVAFTVLAAVSVVEAIDEVPGLQGRCGIRWVNDIVVHDAKLGGVLAYTQTRQRTVTSAILGIGLNVEVTPRVEMTPFVPAVTSLRDLAGDGAHITQRDMFGRLLAALQRNYNLLLQAGYRPLLQRYRQRSTVIGRKCMICTDESDMEPEVVAAGRLVAIGEGLELHLAGEAEPVTRGRLLVRKGAATGSDALDPRAHRAGS